MIRFSLQRLSYENRAPRRLFSAAMDPKDLIAALLSVEIPVSGEAPREILLVPAGTVRARPHDGREFSNSEPERAVARTRDLVLDQPIDYEHQTYLSADNGQPAPAAGWIKEVFVREGAIWARVEWTARAKAMIEAGEYRYISPVLMHDRAGKVLMIRAAALTNDPALYMPALMRARLNTQTQLDREDRMDPEKLRKALGLSKDATDEQVLAAASALLAASNALVATAKALGLAGDAKADEVSAAAKASADGMTAIARAAGLAGAVEPDAIATAVAAARAAGGDPDPTKFVPREEFTRVSDRLTALETSGAETAAASAVDGAIEAGKIPPAQRDWYMAHAKRDLGDFQAFVAGAPVILSPGAITRDPPPDDKTALTTDELAACSAMGITEEQFRLSRTSLLKTGGIV